MEKPLAILFVDICDSTQLYERVGNAEAAQMTWRMLLHLRLVIEVNDGAVIKMLGDGLLAAFPTADDAAWAASTMIASAGFFRLRLRVGVHHGPVIQRSEDLFGDACNVAARVQGIAKPGEALATEAFVELLSPRLQPRAKLLSSVTLRGKSDPIRIHELRPAGTLDEQTVDSTMLGLSVPTQTGGMMSLHLTYKGQELTLNRHLPRLTVGREEGSALRINSRQTSRQHAFIDFSRESFILTDTSTNGTFIRAGGSHPVALRRDATKLVGWGLIGFGAEPMDDGEDHVVRFRCQLA